MPITAEPRVSRISQALTLAGVVALYYVGQLGVALFPLVSIYSSSLWFALGMLLILLAAGRPGLRAASASSVSWFFLLVLWALVGVLVHRGPHVPVAVMRLFNLMLLAYFIIALKNVLERRVLAVSSLYFAMVAGGLLVVVFLIDRWISLPAPRDYDWSWGVQPFLNVRHLDFVLVPAWIAAYRFVLKHGFNAALVVLLYLLLSALFWLGGRGGLLSVAVFLVFLLRVPAWRGKVGALLFIAPFSLLTSALFHVKDPSLGLIKSIFRTSESGNLSSGRFQMWSDLLHYLAHHPWWGYGPDGFPYTRIGAGPEVQPHNAILQIWGELGLPGLFLVAFLVVFFAAALWSLVKMRDWREHSDYVIAVTGAVSFSVLTLLDGVFYHAEAIVLFFTLVVIMDVTAPEAGTLKTVFRNGRLLAPIKLPRPLVSVMIATTLAATLFVQGVSVFADRLDTPAPGSWRLFWIRQWPLSLYASVDWLQDWQHQDPELARRWREWLPRVYFHPWVIDMASGRWAEKSGDPGAARMYYRRALRSAPLSGTSIKEDIQKRIEALDSTP